MLEKLFIKLKYFGIGKIVSIKIPYLVRLIGSYDEVNLRGGQTHNLENINHAGTYFFLCIIAFINDFFAD